MTTQAAIEAARERLRTLMTKAAPTPTTGVNHVAVVSADLERAANFYQGVLGMPLTSVAANRDEPRSTHINIDIGSGAMLSIFDFPDVKQPATGGVGGLMHLAISLPKARFDGIRRSLDQQGVTHQRIGDSVYLHDPDGLHIELTLVD